ncbi:hypothetical protein COLO4_28123 [Corchorus olitorius]|uniref:Uncharacterized protein n=1 Tax=Corchorus olitorius TaxID=93759 RepID=A0A1R3HMY1_9ROSI|nr:hypothetical protein COLO4_28123 [Corchorus olitorius]
MPPEPDLPPRETLSDPTKLFISTLETQLSITYPISGLYESNEFQCVPLLKLITALIVYLNQGYQGCGEACKQLLVKWLGIFEEDVPSSDQAKEMLQNEMILYCLYTRGITNQYPPVISFQTSHQIVSHVIANDRITTYTLNGEREETFCISTPPISQAWISTEFKVHRRLCYARVQQAKILIINAKGAANPEFLFKFAHETFEENPHVVIVTETRLINEDAVQARQSMGYDSSLAVEPVAFLGGTWVLWNSSRVLVRTVSSGQRSLTA